MFLDSVSIQPETFGKTFANYTSFLRILTTKFDCFSIGGKGIFFRRLHKAPFTRIGIFLKTEVFPSTV